MQDSPVNTLLLEGSVVKPPETRHSPAGIPISRFVLEHRSECLEAGMQRAVRLRIGVVAAGDSLSAAAARLKPGDRIRVRGFIARAGYRSADYRLQLHAQTIDIVND